MRASLLGDIDQVAVHVMGVEPVDPHRDRLVERSPVDVAQRLDHIASGNLFVVRRHGVLEI